MNAIQTILHPTDFSEPANHALRLACSLARDHDARLVVTYVAPTIYPVVGELVYVPPIPVEGEVLTREQLREKIEAVHSLEGFPVEFRVERGDPVDGILRVAEEEDAGLIVLGSHGRTGLSRMLLGSVAEKVVRKAPCSVLTVKAPRPETAERSMKREHEMASV